ncbi:hypothetical protein B5X24_HaOG208771 [Helicoverpa armigera]|uniref:Kazal-like domain-containing protein n=1 Tax=Helicoverpa armigera TaxID=29058 RepID=A0A2W1BLR0_HELAM|nr:hypothetical protein B5X24_HaOG208771 [Helicoverpa armigera]
MAANQYLYFLFAFLITQTKSAAVHVPMPEIKEDYNMRSHLKYDNVWEYCSKRDIACKSNNTNICAAKIVGQRRFYKDFGNGCYLFLSNMCDHPEEEYYIVTSGSCAEHFQGTRRIDDGEELNDTLATNSSEINESKEINGTEATFGDDNEDDDALRQAKEEKPFSPLYTTDEAFDGHICPHSCPDVYSPICIAVNRGFGKYFKFLTFINHCLGDLYYCKNHEEFKAPPHEEEPIVQDSPLSWSYCASSRFLTFARFSEQLSAMGHYGWLAGDYKFSHILTPEERERLENRG